MRRIAKLGRSAALWLWVVALLMNGGAVARAEVATPPDYQVKILEKGCLEFAGNGWVDLIIELKARIIAQGTTPANKLVILSRAQRLVTAGGWTTVKVFPNKTMSFTPNGSAHQLTATRYYTLPRVNEANWNYPHRLWMSLRAYNGGQLLFAKTVTKKCEWPQ